MKLKRPGVALSIAVLCAFSLLMVLVFRAGYHYGLVAEQGRCALNGLYGDLSIAKYVREKNFKTALQTIDVRINYQAIVVKNFPSPIFDEKYFSEQWSWPKARGIILQRLTDYHKAYAGSTTADD